MNADLTAGHVRSLGLTGRDFLRELDFTLRKVSRLESNGNCLSLLKPLTRLLTDGD